MQDLYEKLKNQVIQESANEAFVHHNWFVKYHLEIVEAIADELCDVYPDADRLKVKIFVWLHDYEKIVDFDDQYNTELTATRKLMEEIGFDPEYVEDTAIQLNRYNAKDDLPSAPIETQIVSSADAASHFVGPFVSLYWYENPQKSIEELQADNFKKVSGDWEKKITLPEVREAFRARYECALETAGVLPEKYLG